MTLKRSNLFKSFIKYFSMNCICEQVATYGVNFNYKRDRHFTWAQLMVGLLVSVILFLTTYLFCGLLSEFSAFAILQFFGAYIFQFGVTFLTSISYIILLSNLHKRFAAINSLLRLFHCFEFIFGYKNVLISHFIFIWKQKSLHGRQQSDIIAQRSQRRFGQNY